MAVTANDGSFSVEMAEFTGTADTRKAKADWPITGQKFPEGKPKTR